MNTQICLPIPNQLYLWLHDEFLCDLEAKYYTFICRLIHNTINNIRINKQDYALIDRDHRNKIDIRMYGAVSYLDTELYEFHGKNKGHCVTTKQAKKIELYYAEDYEFAKQARRYHLGNWFYAEFLARYKSVLVDDFTDEFVNLYTGKPIDKSVYFKTQCKYKKADKPIIRKALKAIERRVFNRSAVIEHLHSFEIEDSKNKDIFSSFLSDLYSWITILVSGIQKESDNIYSYQPKYNINSSGRVSEIGSGLQSCSRRMKYASIQGIDDIHNYDLKGSQVNGLIHQFNLQDLDTEWLENYVNDDNAKQLYADQVGVTVNTFKQCLLAFIMGGSLSAKSASSVFNYLKNDPHINQDHFKACERLKTLKELLAPVSKSLNKWKASIYSGKYIELGTKYGRVYGGNKLIKNYLGIPYCVGPGNLSRNKLAARILQGQESAFIHNLTVLSSKYGFKVIGNEHDGIITLGQIPKEATEEVKEIIGVSEFSLVEKDIL